MKTTAKFISASLATLLVSASAVTAFAAETKDITVSLRIEGVDSCVLYDNYEIPQGSTAADLIQYADKLSDDVTVTGAENNYITDVNGETAGKFGGWDGWQYIVNSVSPNVGVVITHLATMIQLFFITVIFLVFFRRLTLRH